MGKQNLVERSLLWEPNTAIAIARLLGRMSGVESVWLASKDGVGARLLIGMRGVLREGDPYTGKEWPALAQACSIPWPQGVDTDGNGAGIKPSTSPNAGAADQNRL